MKSNSVLEGESAYSAGLSAYNDYQAQKAAGKSDAEAAGRVAGAVAAAAGCTAAGGIAVAGVCGAIGGAVGEFVGGWLGGSEPPDGRIEICKRVNAELMGLTTLAARAGISVPYATVRHWFVDAAWRSLMPAGWNLEGSVGEPNSAVLMRGFRVPLSMDGRPDYPNKLIVQSPLWFTAEDEWVQTLFWEPRDGQNCIFASTEAVEKLDDRRTKSLVIGLAAVAARFAAMGGSAGVVKSRSKSRLPILIVVGITVGVGWYYARNRK